MGEIILWATGLCLLVYAVYMLRHALGWLQLPAASRGHSQLPVSILIPARNEAQNLSKTLTAVLAQAGNAEVWVIDDESTDDTLAIAQRMAWHYPQLKVLQSRGGKKAALALALRYVRTQWVITLDADCVPGPRWLSTLTGYLQPGTAMVCGPVALRGDRLLQQAQALESGGLMVLAGGAVALGCPGLNNGGNLALHVPTYRAVGGYDGTTHLASGDDMLLMQKLVSAGHGIAYIPQGEALVYTPACATLPQLLAQRRRWLSKTSAYHNDLLMLGSASLAALCLLLPIATIICPAAGLMLWGAKALAELPVLMLGTHLQQRYALLWLWLPLQIAQVPYTLWAAWHSLRPRAYLWKGRVVH